MRETCQSNRAQMNSLKYQRRSRNWKRGRLTAPYHQPASEGRSRPRPTTPYQLPRPEPCTSARSRRPRRRRRRSEDFGRHGVAEAEGGSDRGVERSRASSGISSRSRNCRRTGRIRLCTTSSATMRRGSATRRRTCRSTSKRKELTAPRQAGPPRRRAASRGSHVIARGPPPGDAAAPGSRPRARPGGKADRADRRGPTRSRTVGKRPGFRGVTSVISGRSPGDRDDRRGVTRGPDPPHWTLVPWRPPPARSIVGRSKPDQGGRT